MTRQKWKAPQIRGTGTSSGWVESLSSRCAKISELVEEFFESDGSEIEQTIHELCETFMSRQQSGNQESSAAEERYDLEDLSQCVRDLTQRLDQAPSDLSGYIDIDNWLLELRKLIDIVEKLRSTRERIPQRTKANLNRDALVRSVAELYLRNCDPTLAEEIKSAERDELVEAVLICVDETPPKRLRRMVEEIISGD